MRFALLRIALHCFALRGFALRYFGKSRPNRGDHGPRDLREVVVITAIRKPRGPWFYGVDALCIASKKMTKPWRSRSPCSPGNGSYYRYPEATGAVVLRG